MNDQNEKTEKMLPLPRLPQALAKRGLNAPYITCWRYATAGKIPATLRGARWFYDPADLPRIAAQFDAMRGK